MTRPRHYVDPVFLPSLDGYNYMRALAWAQLGLGETETQSHLPRRGVDLSPTRTANHDNAERSARHADALAITLCRGLGAPLLFVDPSVIASHAHHIWLPPAEQLMASSSHSATKLSGKRSSSPPACPMPGSFPSAFRRLRLKP